MKKFKEIDWVKQSEIASGWEKKCYYCNNAGVMPVSDGEDDFRIDYCFCEAGRLLQARDEMKV